MSEVNNVVPGAQAIDVDAIAAEVPAPEVTEEIPGEVESLESEGDIEAAVAAGDISKKQAAELKKALKIKVDGEEFEETIDFNDEEGLKRHLQKSKAFDKRLKEFSGYKSQVEQAFDLLMKDPEAFMEKVGLNVDDIAERRLARKIEEMQKSPEQIEAEKMRKELEDYKKREKELQEKAQKAELERLKNEQAMQIETDINDALESTKSILPKRNPAIMQRIAQTMLLAMQKGYHNVTAKDVIPLVEKQYKEEVMSVLGSSSDEILEMFATKERLNNYRKSKVQARKAAPPAPKKAEIADTGAKKVEKQEDKPKYRMNDLFGIRPK